MLTPMRAAASSKDFFSAGASRTATNSVIRRRSVPLRRPRSESLMMCLLQWAQVAGVGAEVRAVSTDIGAGARALDLSADAKATGEAGFDRSGMCPVAVDDRQLSAAMGPSLWW